MEIKKESEEEDDPSLTGFVKVIAPEESEDSGDKVTISESTRTDECTESESENKPPPPYSDEAGSSSSGRKGEKQKRDSVLEEYTDAPLQTEPESDVPVTNDESDFRVCMPGSFDDSGPPIPGQGARRVHAPQPQSYPRLPAGGGWAEFMKRLGIR